MHHKKIIKTKFLKEGNNNKLKLLMKKLILIALISFISCSEKEVQLPQADTAALTEILDHSPIYMFFEIENEKDTLLDLNKNNAISSTNWVFNIDKRLPLRLVVPELQKLQEKKKKSAHSKSESIEVFSYSDSIQKKLVFFPFTDVKFKYDADFSNQFIKKHAIHYMDYHNFNIDFDKNSSLFVDGIALSHSDFSDHLKEFSDFNQDGKTILLHLNFDKNVSFGDYLKAKILIWKATNERIHIAPFEFIYDSKKIKNRKQV